LAERQLGHALSEFLGQVEVGGGDPRRPTGRVAMLAFAQVTLDDGLEAGLV
jgi:hypothetical protein